MRITAVNIPEDKASGLANLKMNRLGQVVVLAGKNGSGKSRILQQIITNYRKKPKKSAVKTSTEIVFRLQSQDLPSAQNQLESLRASSKIDTAREALLNANISRHNENVRQHNEVINWNVIVTSELAEKYNIVEFVPKSTNLTPHIQYTKEQQFQQETLFKRAGFEGKQSAFLTKIHLVQERWFNSTHPQSHISEVEKNIAISDYENLKNTIKKFLGTDIDRNVKGNPTLFGLDINELKLSEGQSILLQLCVTIYSQISMLNEFILVLDEPENHLHPEALKYVINKIIECVPDGQVWIATHSVTLLSQFDPLSIWYVNNGFIQHAGKTPEIVLRGLLGDDEEINKLQDFLSLPAQYATSRYAFECLIEPAVAMTDYTDPQVAQIREVISQVSEDVATRILDFGAGKGRLLANLSELSKIDPEKATVEINYVAYDKYATYREECENLLAEIYTDAEGRYFNDYDRLKVAHGRNSFDVVVMCNVLHEIHPSKWLQLFKEDGHVEELIKDQGYLLIVEDTQIPYGEKAYREGFLILDTIHLHELFNFKREYKIIEHSVKNDRLKAHLIPKNALRNITTDSIKRAVEGVKSTSLAKIQELRDREETGYADGRLHGFYSQQATNALLLLQDM